MLRHAEGREEDYNKQQSKLLTNQDCPLLFLSPHTLSFLLSFPVLECYRERISWLCSGKNMDAFSSLWLRGCVTDSSAHIQQLYFCELCAHGELQLNLNTQSLTAPHSSRIIHDVLRHQGRNRQSIVPSVFLNPRPASAHHACADMYYLILLFTLTHSWLSHLCPKNRKLKPLVVPTINLVISQPLLYLSLSLTYTHTQMLFYQQAAGAKCSSLLSCGFVGCLRMGMYDKRKKEAPLWKLLGAQATLAFTGNGTFRSPLCCSAELFAWRK